MKKKKVLFFVQDSVGGAERIAVLISKILDSNIFDIKFVVVPYSDVANSIEDFLPKETKRVNIGKVRPVLKMFRMFKVIWREKPDIVFSSVLQLSNKILPYRMLFPKTKFIIRCENYLYTYSRIQKLEVFLLYRLANKIITQTREMKDELVNESKIPQSKVVVLENPIDKNLIAEKIQNVSNPYSSLKKHIVASGRFCFQKGFDFLIQSFSSLKKKRDDIDLYILGANDGEYKDEFDRVMQIASDCGVIDDVHCLGYKSNPYPYIKYADCFALSSRWEGLPNVLIESLHLGTPVAAFKCVPIVERIVEHGVNGFVALPEDVDSLADAMDKALLLGRVSSNYSGASIEEFKKVFAE